MLARNNLHDSRLRSIDFPLDGCVIEMKYFKTAGKFPTVVPILPLKDMVVFPSVAVPLFLKGSRVIKLAESVVGGDNMVGLFHQKAKNKTSPDGGEIASVGTLARIRQLVRLETGGVKALADGLCRVRLFKELQSEPYMVGEVEAVEEDCQGSGEIVETLVESVATLFKVALGMGRSVSDHSMALLERADTPSKLADLIAVYLPLKVEAKQALLEMDDPLARIRRIMVYLQADIQKLPAKV